MVVRAKFMCQKLEVSKYAQTEYTNIILTPIHAMNSQETEENKKFWAATPSGEIRLNTVNPTAVAQFEPGKQYYIDFTPVEG